MNNTTLKGLDVTLPNGIILGSISGEAHHNCNPNDPCYIDRFTYTDGEGEECTGEVRYEIKNPDAENEEDVCDWTEYGIYNEKGEVI